MKLLIGILFVFIAFTVQAKNAELETEEPKKEPKSFTVEITSDQLNPAQMFEKQMLSKRKTTPRRNKSARRSSRGGRSSAPTVNAGMFVK